MSTLANKANNDGINSNNLTDQTNHIVTSNSNKNDEFTGLKSKLSDRLALFENKMPLVMAKKDPIIPIAKLEKPEQHPSIANKINANKPNLLDRFNKNVNKNPVMIKHMPMFNMEKETPKLVRVEKEIQGSETKEEKSIEKSIEVNFEPEFERETPHEVRQETQEIVPEIVYTPNDQEKLMKRMISAKGVKKGLTNAKDLGKAKASEKILGLANMLQNKVGPKQGDNLNDKNKFLLLNDADIQVFNEENKRIDIEEIKNEKEPENNAYDIDKNIRLERKSVVEMILEKPMYKANVIKKRKQRVFKLKEDA